MRHHPTNWPDHDPLPMLQWQAPPGLPTITIPAADLVHDVPVVPLPVAGLDLDLARIIRKAFVAPPPPAPPVPAPAPAPPHQDDDEGEGEGDDEEED